MDKIATPSYRLLNINPTEILKQPSTQNIEQSKPKEIKIVKINGISMTELGLKQKQENLIKLAKGLLQNAQTATIDRSQIHYITHPEIDTSPIEHNKDTIYIAFSEHSYTKHLEAQGKDIKFVTSLRENRELLQDEFLGVKGSVFSQSSPTYVIPNEFNPTYFSLKNFYDKDNPRDIGKTRIEVPRQQVGYIDTKVLNLNTYAKDSYLLTPQGEVKVYLDLYDDEDIMSEVGQNFKLFNLDSNRDGLLDTNDELFDKLKVRGYDKNGNENTLKLSDVIGAIDLTKFINKEIKNHSKQIMSTAGEDNWMYTEYVNIDDERILNRASDPYTEFDAKYRYKKLDNQEIKSFFESYANADGWVDLRTNNALIFNEKNGIKNFAYTKMGLDNKPRLEEFNPFYQRKYVEQRQTVGSQMSYTEYQKLNFRQFYNDYMQEKARYQGVVEELSKQMRDFEVPEAQKYITLLEKTTSVRLKTMQNEFEKAAGVNFSETNLKLVEDRFRFMPDKMAQMMKDTDSVVAMRLNKSGSITLKFDSGREIEVRELYTDTGKLNNLTKDGRRASLNLKIGELNNDEIKELDFDTLGIKLDGEIVSLKELGTKAVQNYFKKGFLISLFNGDKITAREIYTLNYVDDFLKREDKKQTNKSEEIRFYRKLDMAI
ncbi:hypothetical protein [Campylobacter sp. 19-13652]|uniref:hypothetical protein n=1 Tax=Campylobacter sp. 19-13652 TaxID=2840180 RepID=UPI001C778B80|nr:hypothetical protein [Campylobacter sp. 19-13652]BCX78699.1 hypothetical protein LBC_01610 [Campylobacter sp. 19-13652]